MIDSRERQAIADTKHGSPSLRPNKLRLDLAFNSSSNDGSNTKIAAARTPAEVSRPKLQQLPQDDPEIIAASSVSYHNDKSKASKALYNGNRSSQNYCQTNLSSLAAPIGQQ